ncbi:Do family serine endopeptidase [Phenylobacterium sp. J426]|uniref:Do family serine endopeptidase n=1 Tax=Phenylobacterium sp. J426 TaxID=2898439 RepID=UPI002150C68F|nr:Do family serine endopeptidase [Phenylobacterium sp. J426]MCR5872950.1 Do family serine endopeptidase [Phenylobacterium sp. J426]
MTSKTTGKKTGYLLGAVAGAGVMAAAVAGAGMRMPEANAGQLQGGLIKASTAPIFAPPPGAPMSFADIFDRVSPAVVSINVTSRVSAESLRQIPGFPFNIIPRQPGGGEDGGDEGGQTERGQPRLPTQQSAGSGFFVSADGYIVTNNHVVENAEKITVVLKDETELEATVVGRDEATDLAVIKVKGGRGPYPFVNFENAARPRVGDWVITVGNPFGLGGTATAGIVSAYGRDIGETFVDFIQIDAPINRGNSGGPTFDVYGRVIGVNTAIFSPSGGSVGIGFAIPAEVADGVVKQLINGGRIERGYIGATIQNFTSEMAEASGLGDQKGAIVADLTPGGPSARAGLQVGDIVTSINGQAIRSSSELTRQVARARPGDQLRLEVVRDGRRQNVTIRSGVRPSERDLQASNDNSAPGSRTPGAPGAQTAPQPPVLGMSFGVLDQAARQRLSLPAEVRGALVESVNQNSDAATKGLRRGDVITRANDRAVTSAAELAAVVEAAKKAGRTSVLVGVYRGGRTSFLPLKVSG